jgi:hypothetical protein
LLAREHNGCRRLQRRADEEEDGQFAHELLTAIIDHYGVLMTDQFANYLCQKLLKTAHTEQVDSILRVIARDFTKIAMDQHGTRPLQKLLKKCQPLTVTRSAFLSECIRGDILELATNIHGNHVLQYCIENFSQEVHKEPIYAALIEHCPKVATDR